MNRKKYLLFKIFTRLTILYFSIFILFSGHMFTGGENAIWFLVMLLPAAAVFMNIFPGSPIDRLTSKFGVNIHVLNTKIFLVGLFFLYLLFCSYSLMGVIGSFILWDLTSFEEGFHVGIASLAMFISMGLVTWGSFLWSILILVFGKEDRSLEA
jgi:hypothetical protein